MKDNFNFIATCTLGAEPAVATELRALRMFSVKQGRGSVSFSGDMVRGMRACLQVRSAMKVLRHLGSFPAPNAEALYDGVRAIPWADHMTSRHTFSVDATGQNEELRHTGFIALKAKDALCDAMRAATGSRPDVARDHKPDIPVSVHISGDEGSVLLDMCGDALHRRGYRPQDAHAPLKETLAAAMLVLSGYTGEEDFCDPMAGSGTLLVEAAWMAMRVPPGLDRHFAFERWPNFAGENQSAWHRMTHEAREAIKLDHLPDILGRDWHPDAMAHMEQSLDAANVAAHVRVERGDVRKLELPPTGGIMVTNPPYGERLSQKFQVEGLYRGMGEAFGNWPGWSVHVLCAHPGFEKEFGHRAKTWQRLYNGPLQCRLMHFEARVPPVAAVAAQDAAV